MRRAFPLALGLLALHLPARGGEVKAGAAVFAAPRAQAEEKALRKVLESYVQAIEGRDVEAFRAVKPNLSPEEEQRATKAFSSLQSQTIVMTILSVELQETQALVRVTRRDTINRSIVSSFPQAFTLGRGREGWTIRDIGGR